MYVHGVSFSIYLLTPFINTRYKPSQTEQVYIQVSQSGREIFL